MRARELRTTPTDAESLLWYHLRDRRTDGRKFRRQHPVGKYFADFACIEAKLIIELDGGQHADALAYDADRTRFLQSRGWRVLRFWNNYLLTQTDAVRTQILQALQEDNPHADPLPQALQDGSPHPSPLPQAGEGATPDNRNPSP